MSVSDWHKGKEGSCEGIGATQRYNGAYRDQSNVLLSKT